LICVRPLGFIGFPRSRVPSPFPTGVAGSSLRTPSPTKLPKSFHPPVDSLPLRSTSFSDPHRAAPAFKPVHVGCTFLGVRVPSSRHQRDRIVTAPGLPTPDTFRPWRSSRLRRFPPRSALRVYFTPQPLTGFTLQGISLSHSHDISSTPLCLRVGSTALAIRVAPYATCATAAFKALLHVKVRCQNIGV